MSLWRRKREEARSEQSHRKAEPEQVDLRLSPATEADPRQAAWLAELKAHREALQAELGEVNEALATLVEAQKQSVAVIEQLRSKLEEPPSPLEEKGTGSCEARDSEARAELARDFISVLDEFERCLAVGEEKAHLLQHPPGKSVAERVTTWLSGRVSEGQLSPEQAQALGKWIEELREVHHHILGLLKREGLEPVSSLGQPFDPACHIEIARKPGKAGIVLEERVRGYRLKGKVTRFAEVVVGG